MAHCLGFGNAYTPLHNHHARRRLIIGGGTPYRVEIPLCDACATHPKVDAALMHPAHAVLATVVTS